MNDGGMVAGEHQHEVDRISGLSLGPPPVVVEVSSMGVETPWLPACGGSGQPEPVCWARRTNYLTSS